MYCGWPNAKKEKKKKKKRKSGEEVRPTARRMGLESAHDSALPWGAYTRARVSHCRHAPQSGAHQIACHRLGSV